MKISLDVLTTPSVDTPGTTLMLFFEDRRYVFGQVGEGTQRAWIENGVKMGKVADIFLTGNINWTNSGGLLGMILTMADVILAKKRVLGEVRQIKAEKAQAEFPESSGKTTKFSAPAEQTSQMPFTIHGGKNLMSTIATGRSFIFRQDMSLTIDEIDFMNRDSVVFKDKNITVHSFEILPEEIKQGHKRSYTELQTERHRAGLAQDHEHLQRILSGMFNSKQGSLEVSGDDVDYLVSLEARLKEDAERIKLQQKSGGDEEQGPTFVDLCPPESPSKKPRMTTTDNGNKSNTIPDLKPLRRPWPASTINNLPSTKPSASSISYIVSMPPRRGKFLTKTAIALGVKPGPDFSTLVNGGTVITDNGREVAGQDCMEPSTPIPSIAILDVPSKEYLAGTLDEVQKWMRGSDERVINCFMWILGKDIENEPLYRGFLNKYDVSHIVSSPSVCEDIVPFRGSAAQLVKLNYVHNDHFRLPIQAPHIIDEHNTGLDPPFIIAKAQGSFEVAPRPVWQPADAREPFDPIGMREKIESPEGEEFIKQVTLVNKQLHLLEDVHSRIHFPGEDAEVIALGTGSSAPSKYRNVSANLLRVPNLGNFLLDCGENTLGQIKRTYQPDESQKIFRDLKCIYISHIHADHHLGTVSLIKAWHTEHKKNQDENKRGLYIITPSQYKHWLWEYSQVEDFGYRDCIILSCEDFLHTKDWGTQVGDRVRRCYEDLSLSSLQTSYALHCKFSYTVAFTFSDGFKVAYSGDTRPTTGFVKIGKDCTLLIHEATFDDELRSEAIAKKHSTTSDAIRTGNNMNAKCLLLTHFSQRYPRLPVIEKSKSTETKQAEKIAANVAEDDTNNALENNIQLPEPNDASRSDPMDTDNTPNNSDLTATPTDSVTHDSDMKIGIAFDMLTVKLRDFWRLETLIPALRELFKEEVVEAGYTDADEDGVAQSVNDRQTSKKALRLRLKQNKQAKKLDDEQKRKQSNVDTVQNYIRR